MSWTGRKVEMSWRPVDFGPGLSPLFLGGGSRWCRGLAPAVACIAQTVC